MKTHGLLKASLPINDSAETLEDWLSLVTRRNCRWVCNEFLAPRILRLVSICRRFQSQHLIEQITVSMREGLRAPAGTNPHYIFMVGALALYDPELCKLAIAASANVVWTTPKSGPPNLEAGQPGCWVLDPATMPIVMLSVIPPKYLAALGRAARLHNQVKRGQSSPAIFQARADEFLRWMKM